MGKAGLAGRTDSGLELKVSVSHLPWTACLCPPPNSYVSYVEALIRGDGKDPPIEKSFQVSRITVEEILGGPYLHSTDQRVLR